jgi:hypothetical protein
MKKFKKIVLITTPLLAMSFFSQAHDPKLHAKKTEKANCTAFEKMQEDDKKLDMTDPITIAMKKKCDKQAEENQDHPELDADEHSEHGEKPHPDKMNEKGATAEDDTHH